MSHLRRFKTAYTVSKRTATTGSYDTWALTKNQPNNSLNKLGAAETRQLLSLTAPQRQTILSLVFAQCLCQIFSSTIRKGFDLTDWTLRDNMGHLLVQLQPSLHSGNIMLKTSYWFQVNGSAYSNQAIRPVSKALFKLNIKLVLINHGLWK